MPKSAVSWNTSEATWPVSNISVNADVRERAFVHSHHRQQHLAVQPHLTTRGRRLPLR
jgi:hypothetical protein